MPYSSLFTRNFYFSNISFSPTVHSYQNIRIKKFHARILLHLLLTKTYECIKPDLAIAIENTVKIDTSILNLYVLEI